METDSSETFINAELHSNPLILHVDKESPKGGTSYLRKSTLWVEVNKEGGKESVTIYDKISNDDNLITEAGNLEQGQGRDPFMATLQENIDEDLKKFDGIYHGGKPGVSELSKYDSLFGRDHIKDGEGSERDGPDAMKPIEPKSVGPKLSTNKLSSECFEVDKPRPPL